LSARVLAELGKQYAVYIHEPQKKDTPPTHNSTAEIVLELPAGTYLAEWVNTKNGKVDHREQFAHAGGNRALSSPAFEIDVGLRVRSAIESGK